MAATLNIALMPDHSSIELSDSAHAPITLPALWLRERVVEDAAYANTIHQRLYEHADFPPDLTVEQAQIADGALDLHFSDGYHAQIPLNVIAPELGWAPAPDDPPDPVGWTADFDKIPMTNWSALDDPIVMRGFLEDFFRNGFCIMQNTPTAPGSLSRLCRRFGFLRETNFGELFDVISKNDPSDLAYTDEALASHTDNPYRKPVPGIQFLHCLQNDVPGGLSTLVDGIAIAEELARENPEQAQILEEVMVRFRYDGPGAIMESHGPLIQRDHRGIIRQIRLSSRLDWVPVLDSEKLALFFAARKRLYELSNGPRFKISFPFRPGTLLMMDNYRLLHGRTAYDAGLGMRHLQGCYIDHDGPDCLYRMNLRDGKSTQIRRDL